MTRAARPLRPAAVLLAAWAIVGTAGAAEAHRLKLFVTGEAGEISGRAYFIGGGRPEGAETIIADASGREVHRTRTDASGGFRWRPERPADYRISVDAGDGHRVEATVAADLIAGGAPVGVVATTVPAAPAASGTPSCGAGVDTEALGRLIEARVDTAVARRLRPLQEAWDQAEGRLRFNDVMGGVGMIVGLAGAGLWGLARRRERNGADRPSAAPSTDGERG